MLKKLTAHVLAAALLLAALLLPAAIDADSGWVVKELTVGEAFSLVLMDGVNDGHSTVSIVRGSLPPGLSLDQVIDHSMMRWVVQGTPTAAGVYRAQFLLEPWQNGAPAETSNVYVEFDVSGGAPELVIMTTSLPNGCARTARSPARRRARPISASISAFMPTAPRTGTLSPACG